MKVTINNQIFEISTEAVLEDCLPLVSQGLTKGIAIALNQEVVPQKEWAIKKIKEKDQVLIIQATQGG